MQIIIPGFQATRANATRLSWLVAGLCLVAGITLGLTATARAATAPLVGGDIWAQGYSSHPAVTEARRTGYLTLATQARTLSPGLPLDRALGVVSAMTVAKARKFKVAKGLVRALRTRHSIGPSGAMLNKTIPATTLHPREALLLGWALAREAGGDRTALARRGATIREAGALQLLEQAAAALPHHQAAQLALALARVTVAPRSGKRACEAYQGVQKAARDGGTASVRLSIAEAAVASTAKLGRTCAKAVRRGFQTAIQLPPPPAEPRHVVDNVGRPSRPARSRVDNGGQGIAFAVMAPVFKGYLAVPLVARLVRQTRLDDVMLWQLMQKDASGDTTLAALNASVLMRRLAPDDTFEVAVQAVLRLRGQLGATPTQVAGMKVSSLSGPQAMAIAYARALQGRGLEPEIPGDPSILQASPRQLFAHARQRVPANASLGPILLLAHHVDVQRHGSPCAARERAEATGFVIGKSALPGPAKGALAAAMTTVQRQCQVGEAKR